METSKKQTVNIEQAFSIFNEAQIDAIKLIVRRGFCIDCKEIFADKKSHYAYGYFTNIDKSKQFSDLVSGIAKTLKKSGTNLITMFSDWWGDGRGGMMFLNMDLINERKLKKWAKQ